MTPKIEEFKEVLNASQEVENLKRKLNAIEKYIDYALMHHGSSAKDELLYIHHIFFVEYLDDTLERYKSFVKDKGC